MSETPKDDLYPPELFEGTAAFRPDVPYEVGPDQVDLTPSEETASTTVSTWRVDPPEQSDSRPADTYDVIDEDGFPVVLIASNSAPITLSSMTFDQATAWLATLRKAVGLS